MHGPLGGDEDQGAGADCGMTADGVPAACPLSRSTPGTYGHSRRPLFPGGGRPPTSAPRGSGRPRCFNPLPASAFLGRAALRASAPHAGTKRLNWHQ
jgi:hypothetical protein